MGKLSPSDLASQFPLGNLDKQRFPSGGLGRRDGRRSPPTAAPLGVPASEGRPPGSEEYLSPIGSEPDVLDQGNRRSYGLREASKWTHSGAAELLQTRGTELMAPGYPLGEASTRRQQDVWHVCTRRPERRSPASTRHLTAGRSSLPCATAQRSASALDPNDPDTVYVGLGAGGVQKTTDGAGTWVDVGLADQQVFSVAVSAVDGAIYAGTEPSALFRSDDDGATWRELTGLLALPSRPTWSFRRALGHRMCAGSRRARTRRTRSLPASSSVD